MISVAFISGFFLLNLPNVYFLLGYSYNCRGRLLGYLHKRIEQNKNTHLVLMRSIRI